MNHESFMRLAIDKAVEGVGRGETPFGACIVKDGNVLVTAHNRVWGSTDITAHAEIQAIREACEILDSIDLSGCEIYSTCEPCPMCFSACHWAKISGIYYGARIADAKRYGFSELLIPNDQMKKMGRSSVEITGGVLRDDNLHLFEFWSKEGSGRVY